MATTAAPAATEVIPWELFQDKMKAAGLSSAAQDAFKMNYEQLVAGVTGLVRRVARDGGVQKSARAAPPEAAHRTLLQVPEGDIDPVTELPRLETLATPPGADLKVRPLPAPSRPLPAPSQRGRQLAGWEAAPAARPPAAVRPLLRRPCSSRPRC